MDEWVAIYPFPRILPFYYTISGSGLGFSILNTLNIVALPIQLAPLTHQNIHPKQRTQSSAGPGPARKETIKCRVEYPLPSKPLSILFTTTAFIDIR